jgi:hypothetical protein
MPQKYSSYYAYIYRGDDGPSACLKGDEMKRKFPGCDFEVIEGTPCGQSSEVTGPDEKIADSIKNWINSYW